MQGRRRPAQIPLLLPPPAPLCTTAGLSTPPRWTDHEPTPLFTLNALVRCRLPQGRRTEAVGLQRPLTATTRAPALDGLAVMCRKWLAVASVRSKNTSSSVTGYMTASSEWFRGSGDLASRRALLPEARTWETKDRGRGSGKDRERFGVALAADWTWLMRRAGDGATGIDGALFAIMDGPGGARGAPRNDAGGRDAIGRAPQSPFPIGNNPSAEN